MSAWETFLKPRRPHPPDPCERCNITNQDLAKLEAYLITIMNTQAELAAQLRVLAQGLREGNAEIVKVQGTVAKVGGDVEALQKQIIDLNGLIQAGGTITQELQDAADEVTTQVGTVKDGIAAVDAGLTAVDDKVPAAPATPAA